MVSKEQEAKESRIVKGIAEILEFRGFDILKTTTNEDVIDTLAEKKNQDGDKIKAIARFPKESSVGVKTIRELDRLRKEEDIHEAILIAEATLTHYARKESLKLGIEIISSSNPLFNIFDHNLVPNHDILSESDVKDMLRTYQIEKHQIPKILESDSAIKAVQAKPGDVVKITRNPSMGEAGSYYRFVIKSASRLRLADAVKPKRTKKDAEADSKGATKKTPTKTAAKKKTPTKTAAKKKTPTKTAAKKKTPTKTAAKKKTPTKTAAKKKTPTKTAAKKKTPTKTAAKKKEETDDDS